MSTGPISPKETTYQGVKFRSRLEARWAICFDTAGVVWEYEPVTVQDERTKWKYTPDFWIQSSRGSFLVEVKPQPPTKEYLHNLIHFANGLLLIKNHPKTSSPLVLFCGNFYDIGLAAYKLHNSPTEVSLAEFFSGYKAGIQAATNYRFDLEKSSNGLRLPSRTRTRKVSNRSSYPRKRGPQG